MKRKIILFGTVMFAILFSVSSCQKDELIYSCNPEVDQLVKSNLKNISSMGSDDWQNLDNIEYQRGVYNAFNQEQRISLWKNKFNQALLLDWTPKEREYINQLIDFTSYKSELFLENINLSDEILLELYKLVEYASEVLGWDYSLIYNVLMTPELLNQDKKVISKLASNDIAIKTRSESGEVKTCNCAVFSPNYPWEGLPGHDPSSECITGNCHVTTAGCGLLWLERCIGVRYR